MPDFFNILSSSAGLIVFFLVLIAGMFIIPFGLPGTFLQVAAAAILATATHGTKITWGWVLAFLLMALIGEAIEFMSGQWGAKRFGGSKAAAWGALIGGLLGAMFGGILIPIPVIGSLIASFIGTFAGAVYGQMRANQEQPMNLRVGFGAVLGRAIGVAIKLFIALTILIASAVIVLTHK
ncbi:MAG TPA: DUF456 domain-containing protein [Planctomycetota bacterium]|jgi:hypothetical protein